MWGATLTSKIDFKEILEFLLENGFRYNSFPIFLNLEMHCSSIAKFILKDILEKNLKSQLFIIPANH